MFHLRVKFNTLYRQCLQNGFLKNIAYLLPFFIIISISFTFMWFFNIGKGVTSIKGLLLLGIPAILSSLILIGSYKRTDVRFDSLNIININNKFAIQIFTLLYCLSILVLLTNNERPFNYFVLLTTIYSIIFIQIISKKDATNIILIEIVLCMLNLIYGVVLKYPLYFGYTDTLGHLVMSKVTYVTGSIIPTDYALSYANYPLYHILVAEGSYLMGIDIQNSLFLMMAPVFSIIVVFIYYIFYRTTGNSKVSLLTCMLFSVSSVVITYGVYIITRTMAFIGFIVILYLIYANFNEIKTRALLLFMSFFLLLVHQVSFPQILVLLCILGGCQQIAKKKTYLRYGYLRYLSIFLFFYWFFISYGFTNQLFEIYTNSGLYDSVIILEGISTIGSRPQEIWYSLINRLDTSIFIFFSLIGIGYLLWNDKKNQYTSVFVLFSLIVLPLFIPNPLQSLWQTMDLFRFDRFMLLLSPFMAFVMSCGIFIFYKYYSQKHTKSKYALVMLIIVLLSIFTFVSITKSVQDTNILSSQSPRAYFTKEELNGFSHIFNFVQFGSQLHSDHFTDRFFGPYKLFNGSYMWNIPHYESNFIDKPSKISKYSGYIIMRDQAFNQDGIYIGHEGNTLYLKSNETVQIFKENLVPNNRIYSNSYVSIYLHNNNNKSHIQSISSNGIY